MLRTATTLRSLVSSNSYYYRASRRATSVFAASLRPHIHKYHYFHYHYYRRIHCNRAMMGTCTRGGSTSSSSRSGQPEPNIDRFRSKSNEAFPQALAEIQRGHKSSHWIWFIFPQLQVLGRSGTARYYGITSLAEAAAFLQDPVLGPRLVQISTIAAGHLSAGADIEVLMGQGIDAAKLLSCATLFEAAAASIGDAEKEVLFRGLKDLCIAQLGAPDLVTENFCKQGPLYY